MPLVPEHVLKKVKAYVVHQFPEMEGVSPHAEEITLKPESAIYKKLGIAFPKNRGEHKLITLNFSTTVKTDDGSSITRAVRVLINKSGTILKVTTSR